MMEVILRKAEKIEGYQLLELVNKVLGDYGLKIDPLETDKDLLDLDKFYFNKNGWFSVLEIDKNIIGSYGIYFIDVNTCELRKMYVLKEFQGKGYGKLLLEDSISKAKELGFKKIILETNRKLDKAVTLYLKYGFEEFKPDHLSERCDFAMKMRLK